MCNSSLGVSNPARAASVSTSRLKGGIPANLLRTMEANGFLIELLNSGATPFVNIVQQPRIRQSFEHMAFGLQGNPLVNGPELAIALAARNLISLACCPPCCCAHVPKCFVSLNHARFSMGALISPLQDISFRN